MVSLLPFPAVFSPPKKKRKKYVVGEKRDREAVLVDKTGWRNAGAETASKGFGCWKAIDLLSEVQPLQRCHYKPDNQQALLGQEVILH